MLNDSEQQKYLSKLGNLYIPWSIDPVGIIGLRMPYPEEIPMKDLYNLKVLINLKAGLTYICSKESRNAS